MPNSCSTGFLSSPRSLVPGVGPADARIAFVGEIPGAPEHKAQEPFKGLGGSLLTELMHSAGIPRSECYLTDVVKEIGHGRDAIDKHFTFARGGVKESPEFKEYKKLLRTELNLVHSNVIVAVGNAALWALCEKLSVNKWRGSILESTLLPGRKVIPIIHPSTALYKYIWRHWISFDLRRINRESEFPEIRPSKHEYIIGPSFSASMAFMQEILDTGQATGFDIEVMNEEVSCFSLTQPLPNGGLRGISIPLTKNGREYFSLPQEVSIMLKLEEILESKDIRKVMQNGTFDTTFMYRKYGIRTYNIDDTMIGEAVMYPDFPKGLDFITSIHTNEPYYKDEGKKHFKFGGRIEDFWLYNAKDSVVCTEAMGKIKEDLIRAGNYETYERQVRLIEPLVAITERGVKVDLEARKKKSDYFETQISELTEKLHSIAGFPLNFNSPKQLIEYFYEKKGQKAYVNRKTGKATVDDQALKRLSRKGLQEASIIREIRTYAKRRSTYLEMQLDTDGRLRGSYNPVGTGSLRLSSSKTIFDTGGNMQNLPYDIREFCQADDGYVCYQMDLGQAENRAVAYISRESAMIEAFETGKDIHRRTAGLIFNKPEDEISDEDGSSSIGGGAYSERFWGKKANHGLNYDFGYKSFAFMYEIPEADAKFIVDKYHNGYPGVRRYHQWVREQLGKNRTLTNIFGWNRIFLDRWDDNLFKEAYSFIPQSSIGCLMNYSGVSATYYDCPYKAVELQNQIHDAIWFQIPIKLGWKYHARALLWIKASLEQPLTYRTSTFSIPVDTEIGLNYGHAGKDNPKGLTKVKFSQGTSVETLALALANIYNKMQ